MPYFLGWVTTDEVENQITGNGAHRPFDRNDSVMRLEVTQPSSWCELKDCKAAVFTLNACSEVSPSLNPSSIDHRNFHLHCQVCDTETLSRLLHLLKRNQPWRRAAAAPFQTKTLTRKSSSASLEPSLMSHACVKVTKPKMGHPQNHRSECSRRDGSIKTH